MEMKKYRWGQVKIGTGESGNLVGEGDFTEKPDPEVQDDKGHAVMIDDQAVYLPANATMLGISAGPGEKTIYFLVPDDPTLLRPLS